MRGFDENNTGAPESPELKFIKSRQKKRGTGGNEPEKKSKLTLWWENFIYHYKWHAIAALFLVCVLIFLIVSTATKTEFDGYVMYAGGKNLRTYAEGDDGITYTEINSAFSRFTTDVNGDGNRVISFLDIYLPSDEEIKAAEAKGDGINYSLLRENDETFRYNMLSGDYYICLISESLFLEWTKDEKNNPFVKIAPYLPEGAKLATGEGDEGYRLPSEYGVYLSSTPSADNQGFKNLPEDTVICLRSVSGALSKRKSSEKLFAGAEEMLRNLLADKAYT